MGHLTLAFLLSGAQLGVEASVFLLPDGKTLVAVVSNVMGSEDKTVKLVDASWSSAAVVVDVPARSVITVQIDATQPGAS